MEYSHTHLFANQARLLQAFRLASGPRAGQCLLRTGQPLRYSVPPRCPRWVPWACPYVPFCTVAAGPLDAPEKPSLELSSASPECPRHGLCIPPSGPTVCVGGCEMVWPQQRTTGKKCLPRMMECWAARTGLPYWTHSHNKLETHRQFWGILGVGSEFFPPTAAGSSALAS